MIRWNSLTLEVNLFTVVHIWRWCHIISNFIIGNCTLASCVYALERHLYFACVFVSTLIIAKLLYNLIWYILVWCLYDKFGFFIWHLFGGTFEFGSSKSCLTHTQVPFACLKSEDEVIGCSLSFTPFLNLNV